MLKRFSELLWRVSVLIRLVWVAPSVQQMTNHVSVAVCGAYMQQGRTRAIPHPNRRRPRSKQRRHDCRVAAMRRANQRIHAHVDARASLQQQRHDVSVPGLTRPIQRRAVVFGGDIDRHTGIHQHGRNVSAPVGRSAMQRAPTKTVSCFRPRARRQQLLHVIHVVKPAC